VSHPDPGSLLPWRVVEAELRKRLENGYYAIGSRLSTRTLADDFGVSHATVYKALQSLAEDGWIALVPQYGSVVLEPPGKEPGG
jgi:DNA-binding GntR family transcriptional regulator